MKTYFSRHPDEWEDYVNETKGTVINCILDTLGHRDISSIEISMILIYTAFAVIANNQKLDGEAKDAVKKAIKDIILAQADRVILL